MATGQNSYICSEDSCINPVADSLINIENIYSLCSEEAVNMAFKGHIPWNKGIKGIYNLPKGIHTSPKTEFKKGHGFSTETITKISDTLKELHKEKKIEHTKTEFKKGNIPWIKGKKGLTKAWNKGKVGCFKDETIERLSKSHKGKHQSEETIRKRAEAMRGEKNPRWLGGISFLPYCHKFNEELKEFIRERDNRTCQLCGVKENGRKLDCHHVHYDKPNCNPNLIALCFKCNIKANNNRDYYEDLFIQKLKDRGLILMTCEGHAETINETTESTEGTEI